MLSPHLPSLEAPTMMAPTLHGNVIYGISEENGKSFVDFWIHETSDFLEKIPEKPPLEFRVGALLEEKVLLVTMLFRLMPEAPLYETFWDYHYNKPKGAGQKLFEGMATDSSFFLYFFDSHGNFHSSVETFNILRPFFRQMTQQAAALPTWTREQFEKARHTLLEQYPTPEALWAHLSDSNSITPDHELLKKKVT